MPVRAVSAPLLAVTILLVTACGGGGRAHRPAPATAAAGRAVFSEHCSACHSIDGRDHPSLQGGDLLGFHTRRAQLVQFVREMPVVHRPLSSPELRAVVAYVQAAEQRAR